MKWRGEICKKCFRRNCIGFNVDNNIWLSIVKNKYNVLCITCFDELAEKYNIPYRLDKNQMYVISWSDWVL